MRGARVRWPGAVVKEELACVCMCVFFVFAVFYSHRKARHEEHKDWPLAATRAGQQQSAKTQQKT